MTAGLELKHEQFLLLQGRIKAMINCDVSSVFCIGPLTCKKIGSHIYSRTYIGIRLRTRMYYACEQAGSQRFKNPIVDLTTFSTTLHV